MATDVDYDEMIITSIEAGNDMDITFANARAAGATAMDCIHALRQLGFEVADAQKVIASSSAWADVFALAKSQRPSA